MRLAVMTLAICVACTPAVAQGAAGSAPPQVAAVADRGVANPRAFVEQVYARYRAAPGVPPEDPVHAYSDRLRALFDAYNAWQAAHDDLVGSVAFDWWTNSQDWGEIRMHELREEQEGPDRLAVVARFAVYDAENVNRFRFVRAGGRWYLDDVVNGSGHGGDGWTLSALLRERPE